MPLNDLDLEQLTELAATLEQIADAGRVLAASGLYPRFDLTPGKPARITVPFAMPCAAGQVPIQAFLAARSVELSRQRDGLAVASDVPTPSTEAAQPEPALAPVDAPPVAEGPAGGAPEPAAPSRSGAEAAPLPAAADEALSPEASAPVPEGVADSGGGADMAAPAPPAAPAPTTGTHQASFGQNAWTEEEDARLISLVVGGMVGLAMGKTAAIRAAARELGRPEQGTAFRCHHKLKGRLAAALAEAKAEATAPSPLPDPAAQPAAAPEPETAPKPATTLDKHAADPLTAHLMALPEKDGWTLARDLDLMELSLAGWMPNEIGLELKVRADLVKARFDLLTGLHTDEATGKQARRWSREAVFEALQNLSRASQKGAA